MAQLLVNVVSVTNLAGGATVSVAHNLESNGVKVAPTLVFPDRATTIAVQSVDVNSVTFINKGVGTASAIFRCERGWQPEVDAFSVTPLLYGGSGNASGGAGYFRAASLLSQVSGLTTGDLPITATIPANSFRAGSAVRLRVAGLINVSVANSTFNLTLFANAGKTNRFGSITTAALAFGAPAIYSIVIDMEGSVGTAGTVTWGSANATLGPAGTSLVLTIAPGINFDPTVVNVITPSITFGTPNVGTTFDLQQFVLDIAF